MENLRKIRKAKGLNQKELASLVGVSESSISQYETGGKNPSFEVALKIAEVLDCEFADLVTKRETLINLSPDDDKKIPVTQNDGLNWTLSESDKRLLIWFRSLPQEKQKAILIAQDAPEDVF